MDRFIMPVATAREVAAAVGAVPGVHGLHAGQYGEIALLFPGEKVSGLRFASPRDDAHLEVHLVADAASRPILSELADAVRAAAFAACPALHRVDVIVADAA